MGGCSLCPDGALMGMVSGYLRRMRDSSVGRDFAVD